MNIPNDPAAILADAEQMFRVCLNWAYSGEYAHPERGLPHIPQSSTIRLIAVGQALRCEQLGLGWWHLLGLTERPDLTGDG